MWRIFSLFLSLSLCLGFSQSSDGRQIAAKYRHVMHHAHRLCVTCMCVCVCGVCVCVCGVCVACVCVCVWVCVWCVMYTHIEGGLICNRLLCMIINITRRDGNFSPLQAATAAQRLSLYARSPCGSLMSLCNCVKMYMNSCVSCVASASKLHRQAPKFRVVGNLDLHIGNCADENFGNCDKSSASLAINCPIDGEIALINFERWSHAHARWKLLPNFLRMETYRL